jgi:ssDNA-binding Zn-finger/Zn-ribbon topoisomerase 1
MARAVSCPECGTENDIEPNEYGIFTVRCSNCPARSKGENAHHSGEISWRWTKTAADASD